MLTNIGVRPRGAEECFPEWGGVGRAEGWWAGAAALQCLHTTCRRQARLQCAWQTGGPARPASRALLQRSKLWTREARLRPFALRRARASFGVRPHILGWDVAQGVMCPSDRAHEQEDPASVQQRLLFTQATLSLGGASTGQSGPKTAWTFSLLHSLPRFFEPR